MARAKDARTSPTTTRANDHGLKLVTAPAAPATDPSTGPSFVELIRVSGQGQMDKDTPENQRQALDKLRAHRPGDFVERIDPHRPISGNTPIDQREDIQRLRLLAEARAFKELRVYHIDRLTRAEDPRERMAIFGIVADAGAIIVDVAGREVDPTDEMGELGFYMSTWAAAVERKRIRQRTADGRRRAAAEGRFSGGAVPFGLKWHKVKDQPGAYVMEEGKADIVREMFLWAAEGRSTWEIAVLLQARGIKSPKKKPTWHPAAVGRMLRKRAYIGSMAINAAGETFTHDVPAIIDDELWERVQAALNGRTHKPRPRESLYPALCRGKLLCGVCGLGMYVRGYRGGKNVYYMCGGKHTYNDKSCTSPNHRVDLLDAAVWSEIRRHLEDPGLLREASESAHDAQAPTDPDARIAELESKLKEIEDHELQVLDLRRAGLSEGAVKRRIRRLGEERHGVELELKAAARARAARDHLALDRSAIEDRVRGLLRGLDEASFETRRDFVEALVPDGPGASLTIHPDGRIELKGMLDLGPTSVSPSTKAQPHMLTRSA